MYVKKTWAANDLVTAATLQNIEDGVSALDTAMADKADLVDGVVPPDQLPAPVIYPVVYTSGAWPTVPATPPPGVSVRMFYGPSPYSGASWAGVTDIFVYTA